MKTKIFILIIILAGFLTKHGFAQDKAQLTNEVNKVLQNYEKYSRMTEDEMNISERYKEEFVMLFVTPYAPVYNDISAKQSLDESVSAMTYAEQLESWYSIGINSFLTLPIQEDQLSEIQRDTILTSQGGGSANRFFVDAKVEKSVFGFYKTQKIQRHIDTLYFRISYIYEGGGFKSVLISAIFKKLPPKPEQQLQKNTLGMGFKVTPGISYIKNTNTVVDDYTSTSPKFGYNFAFEIHYFLNELIAIGTGLETTKYKSELRSSQFQGSFTTTDIDNESYTRKVSATNIKETQEIQTFDLPLFIKMLYRKDNNIGVYCNLGVKASMISSKKLTATGLATYQGYYSKYNVTLYDLKSYGFLTDDKINANKDLNLNSLAFSAFASIGVSIPLNPKVNVNIGVQGVMGLNNVAKGKESDYQLTRMSGDYSSLMNSATKATTMFIGLEIGIIYNLTLVRKK